MTATSRQREMLEATQTYCPPRAFPSGVPLKGCRVEGEPFFTGFLSPPALRGFYFHQKMFLVKKKKKKEKTTKTTQKTQSNHRYISNANVVPDFEKCHLGFRLSGV